MVCFVVLCFELCCVFFSVSKYAGTRFNSNSTSRIQAVPEMFLSLLSALKDAAVGGGKKPKMPTVQFCDAVQVSNVPLSVCEAFMLSQLLCRGVGKRADTASAVAAATDAMKERTLEDVLPLLNEIKRGEILNAVLN